MIPVKFLIITAAACIFIGAAMQASTTYRNCVLCYILIIAVLSLLGVSDGWIADMVIMAGVVMGCLGVASGFVALWQGIWK